MNELQQKTINSIEVAEMIGKEHANLLKDIRRYIDQSAEVNIDLGEFFQPASYLDTNNQGRPCYDITKKGCEFIGNKLTGAKGTEFTFKYINRFHDMEEAIQSGLLEGLSDEMKALLMHDKKIQVIMQHVSDTDNRVDRLENNMVIDYGQQRVLTEKVSQIVMHWLGGKESNAYSEIGKKVFKECGRDFNEHFSVNSRNNTPKLKFDDAVYYLAHWEPCMNTKLEIQNCNAQMCIS